MSLLDLLYSRRKITAPIKDSARIINICMRCGIEYSKPRFCEAGFCIECSAKNCKILFEECQKRNLRVESTQLIGVTDVALALCKRAGLLLGLLAAFFLVFFSMRVVWRIEVYGNEELSRGAVEAALAENGFGVGSYIPDVELTSVESSVMKNCPDIAWISINLDGTVAKVEIRETQKVSGVSTAPAHLVALRDGEIERVESYNGNCLVKVGDVVRAGDILVSGIYENSEGGYRVTAASGAIFARTVRDFSVEIPYKTTEKIYTGLKKGEIYINFFKKSIKVFTNSRNLPVSCDIIYENGKVLPFISTDVPVEIKKITYCEYEEHPIILTEHQAMEKAFEVLEAELDELSESVELLRKELEFEIRDDAYVLRCRIVCVENIAMTREITVG